MQFLFPPSTLVNRIIPKSKLLGYAGSGKGLKEKLTRDVEHLVWANKLSPDTINIPAGKVVSEIQVFLVELKKEKVDIKLLEVIDRSIPTQILFICRYGTKSRYVMTWKRPSESVKGQWVTSHYVQTVRESDDGTILSIPYVVSLDDLAGFFLENISGFVKRQQETPEQFILRLAEMDKLQKEIAQLEQKIQREPQFNRKVELNSEIKKRRFVYDELSN